MESECMDVAETVTPLDKCGQDCSYILRILDNDALHYLFKYLPITDICNISQCCRRLNRIAENELLHKLRTTRVHVVDPDCRIFRQYSPEIRDLVMCASPYWLEHKQIGDILENVTKLEKLRINYCFGDLSGHARHFGNAFSSLTQLELNFHEGIDVDVGLVKSNMERCHQLEKLKISKYISLEIFEVHYPKLQELSIVSSRKITEEILGEFFSRHTNLIHLDLQIYKENFLNQLDLSCLSVLQNLNALIINVEAPSVIMPNINEMPNLNYVSLVNYIGIYSYRITQAINNYCEVACSIRHYYRWRLIKIVHQRQITSLVSGSCITEKLTQMITFVKQCRKLKQISIHNSSTFLTRSLNIIIINPEIIVKFIPKEEAAELKHFSHLNSDKSPWMLFTHFKEIASVSQITVVELSNLSRYELMDHYPTLKIRKKNHIREAEFTQTNEYHSISRYSKRNRIFFANVKNELTIFRFTL